MTDHKKKKKEKIAIIEEKTQQENSNGCGREVTETEIQNYFKKNEYSNQKQTKDLLIYRKRHMYAWDQLFRAHAVVCLSSGDIVFGAF